MIKAFPKIFHIGTKYIQNIFEDDVVVEEKVDGSYASFAKVNGELYFRSKGKIQPLDCPDKLFQQGADYLKNIEREIPENLQFHCEYLSKEKHNTLSYDRIPKNHFVLFGVKDLEKDFFVADRDYLQTCSDLLGIECIPTIFEGKIKDAQQLKGFLETTSVLGGQKIEGVVVKNYHKDVFVGGQLIPFLSGKYVSEEFKEVHKKNWSRENTSGGKWQTFMDQYRTEARWNKAIIHLKERGELEEAPRDIGKLMKEVQKDIDAECKEEIKEFLYREFGEQLKKNAVKGLPDWYKDKVMKLSFGGK